MIAGVPFGEPASFFSKFMTLVRRDLGEGFDSRLVSFPGFPSQRAISHSHRIWKTQPDFLVIQLGSTNLTVDLVGTLQKRLGWRKSEFRVPPPARVVSETMGPCRIGWKRRCINVAKVGFCTALRIEPIHGGVEDYLRPMRKLLEETMDRGVVPLVISPFPHGDPVSNRWSIRYSLGLGKLCEEMGVAFIDSHQALSSIPLHQLLLADYLHLSEEGHRVLANALHERWTPLLAAAQRDRQNFCEAC